MPSPQNLPSRDRLAQASELAQESWDSTEFFRVVLEKLWLIVLIAVVGFFVAFGYLAHLTPLYEATGSLQVQPPPAAPSPRPLLDQEPNLSSIEELNTLTQDLQRPAFLLEVANDPGLLGDLSLYPAKPDGTPYTDQDKIKIVAECVKAALIKNTLLIVVTARHAQPVTAQRLCEAMLQTFVRERMEKKTGSEQQTYQFLLGEAERLGKALAGTERAIQKYDQLAQYDAQIVAQKARLAELTQRYKEKYPAMIEGRALLAAELAAFDREMLRILQSDQASGIVPVVTIDPAVGVTEEARARMMGQYQVLKREIETQRTVFGALTAQKNQSDVFRSAQSESAVRIADRPILPEKPISQNPLRLLIVGVFGGALLGLGLAFLFNALDRSIHTVDQAEAFLDLPVLSAVPEAETARKNSGSGETGLPILGEGFSPTAEAIRSLRASISLLGRPEERRTLVFTSALPGEGKSFTCANYSIALARQGVRTLLVDVDLRRPVLHRLFGLTRTQRGFTDFCLGAEPLAEFTRPTAIEGLDLLLSGIAVPNPAELLAGGGFARLMAAATGYDQVIIDTAPILAVGDTLTLVGQVDAVCLVVRAAASPREAVLRAVKVLTQAERRPVGLVFNRVPRRADLGYHRTYYYHYGSGRYGDAYGAPTQA